MRDREDFRLELNHVVAEGNVGNAGRRPDAVGLHAGHDLSSRARGHAEAGGQGTAREGEVRQGRLNEPFRRAIVDYHRKEMPGSIVVDFDNHYLYLVQDSGKAIRYGITVGEEALAFSGIANVGNMAEWPKWDIISSIFTSASKACRHRCPAASTIRWGPARSTSIRAAATPCSGFYGTNQPEYIGASISSGCIRMTNEDVIDLYSRVKMGTVVVVPELEHGDLPYNSKMALQGGSSGPMMQ